MLIRPMMLRGPAGAGGVLRPQDVFAVLTQPANQMQGAINALPFAADLIIDKDRVAAGDWSWRSRARSNFTTTLASNTTAAEASWPGYSGTNNRVAYALQKRAKVCDEVTWTGNGTRNTTFGSATNAGTAISHALGIKPGAMFIKARASATKNDWLAAFRSAGNYQGQILLLNSTAGPEFSGTGQLDAFTDATTFTPGSFRDSTGNFNAWNENGVQYDAYLFAHDPDPNGIIQCGSFTTDANGAANVTLGWMPQFLKYKRIDAAEDWFIRDAARGFNTSSTPFLRPNLPNAETSVLGDFLYATSTGFRTGSNGALSGSATYVFTAIRAPI